MQKNHVLSRVAAVLVAVVLAIALSSCSGPTASEFVGKWSTEDTQGKPMEITLSEDGSAKGTREGEDLTGTWKDENGAAVINWDTGWTTKIVKEGDKYRKMAYDEGKPADGAPSHTADAEKVTPKK